MGVLDDILRHEYCPSCGSETETDRRTDKEPAASDDLSHWETTRAKVECPDCDFSKWASRSSPVMVNSRFAVDDTDHPNLTDWLP